MKPKDISKHAAAPSRIFTTLLILLIAVVIVQGITQELLRMVSYFDPANTPSWEHMLNEEDRENLKIARADKVFLPDGTLHLIHRVTNAQGTRINRKEIFDANNNLLWQGPLEDKPYDYLLDPQSYSRNVLYSRNVEWTQQISPDTSMLLEIPAWQQDDVLEVWRYVPSKAVFVGYDKSGRNIGYMGSAGVAQSPAKAGAFDKFRALMAYCPPDSYSPTLLWQTDQSVHQIDFEHQKIDVLIQDPQSKLTDIVVHNWAPQARPSDLDGTQLDESRHLDRRPLLYCLSKNGTYHLLAKQPDQTITVKMPEEWSKWCGNYCAFAATGNNVFMIRQWVEYAAPGKLSGMRRQQWQHDYNAKDKKHWTELYSVDEAGNLNLVNQFGWIEPSRTQFLNAASQSPYMLLQRYLTTLSPPTYRLLPVLEGSLADLVNRNQYSILRELYRGASELAPRNLPLSLLLSAAMTLCLFCHAWPRRTSNAAVGFWLVFTMLFGLAGLFTYLALNYTPTVKCTSCGKRRGLAQPECPHCNAPLPRPEPRELDVILST